jgi:hypothetical protein
MKREIAKYVAECDTCQRVKANHLRPAGNLHPLSIPKWKWEDICMDFIVGLPRTSHEYDYMGHCGPLDQVGSFHTHMHLISGQKLRRAIHLQHCSLSWYTEDHHL